MKKINEYTKAFALCLLMVVSLVGCSEDDEKYPTFDPPIWQVNNIDYSVTMTAVIQLPNELIQYANDDDQIAAFGGDICRGVGEIIDGLWYVTIYGTPEDQTNIYFQYYGARNKYLYESPELFFFEEDETIGSADDPSIVPFSIVKNK